MSRPCFSLILIVLVALSGCSRSQSSDPSRRVVIDVPEDGGQAGNGFESNWSDSYRNDPRYHSIRTSTSSRSPRPTRPTPEFFKPEEPKPSQPQPGVTTSTPQPEPTFPSPEASSPLPSDPFGTANREERGPIDVAALSPTLEPVILKISMTEKNGRVKVGAGVVVGSNGVVVTSALLIEDAVSGEVEFCNKQKTKVIGHFAADNVGPTELVAILIDTHGHSLDAKGVSPALAKQRTTARMGLTYLCYDVRRDPFRPRQIGITTISAVTRPGSSPPRLMEEFSAPAPPDFALPGSPWFDRSGALIAITIPSQPGKPLQAVAINEIADKLPGLSIANVKRYDDK